MRRWVVLSIVLCAALVCGNASSYAQNWKKVLQLDSTFGSSAFFFNGNEGVIGTGHYQSGLPARIYYTNDGGVTWHRSRLINPNIAGQVTDLYFRDRLHGWATICEFAEKGWSGVYHTTDGGLTWDRAVQAGFPVGVRETKRGVFYTDRNINNGVSYSSNGGKTWRQVGVSATALGIDFIDDQNGFVVSQAISVIEPHLITTDGGLDWQTINATPECWSVYGDPITRSFFLASEHDRLTLGSSIVKVPVSNAVESRIKTYGDPGLAGGIAGSHVCQSAIYAQGRPDAQSPDGLVRSTNGGTSWLTVGGPNNLFDKRFAVTGRGAVVVAFDDSGGVWMTRNGGDGLLSPSVAAGLSISDSLISLKAPACDSVSASVTIGYHFCDSVQLSKIVFVGDSLGELRTDVPMPSSYISSIRPITFHIIFGPKRAQTRTTRLLLSIRQPDGYVEDTSIVLQLNAGPARISALAFSQVTAKDTLDFDSVSTCVGSSRQITLTNMGCTDLSIDSIYTNSLPFYFGSTFHPFTLSSGTWRSFLIGYSPDTIRRDRAVLYIRHSGVLDSLLLFGTGYSSGEALSLVSSGAPIAPECDSVQFTITLQNIACKSFEIDSIVATGPLHAISSTPPDSLHPRDKYNIPFEFVPSGVGPDTGTVRLRVNYEGGSSYDTTLRIIGSGSIGKPSFTVSRDSIFLGNVSFCSSASDTITLRSLGCSQVTVATTFDTTTGFTLAKLPKTTFTSHDSDVVTIRYLPHHRAGLFTEDLVLNTSAGIKRIPITVNVTSDPGAIGLSTTPSIATYVCQDTPFTLSIANTLCDSIFIKAAHVIGKDSLDFALLDTLPIVLRSGERHDLAGLFTPRDSLRRSAAIAITIQTNDTTFDTTVALTATGIGVPPMVVGLSQPRLHAPVLQTVSVPVVLAQNSTLPVGTLDATLLFNTDLLSPTSVNNKGSFANAVTKSVTVHPCNVDHALDTVAIHLVLGSNTVISAGELFELDCMPYVTKVLSTNIILSKASFSDLSSSTECLSSERIDTIANFELDRDCGDTTLAHVLGYNQIAFTSVSPNPSSGSVDVTFRIARGYANDARLEIYDVVGRKLNDVPVIASSSSQELTVKLDLAHNERGEGLRYLRLETPRGSQIRSVLLVR